MEKISNINPFEKTPVEQLRSYMSQPQFEDEKDSDRELFTVIKVALFEGNDVYLLKRDLLEDNRENSFFKIVIAPYKIYYDNINYVWLKKMTHHQYTTFENPDFAEAVEDEWTKMFPPEEIFD